MELQLLPTQKAKLLELYQALQFDLGDVNIQINSTEINVQTSESSTQLVVPTQYRKTRAKNFTKFIDDALNAELDMEMDLYLMSDLLSLINIAVNQSKTNGQRLYAYSKI